MSVDGVFTALRTNVAGMRTQMKRLEVISENIANAESVADENGNVYKRKVVNENPASKFGRSSFGDEMRLKLERTDNKHLGSVAPQSSVSRLSPVQSLEVDEVEGEQLVYDPGNPKADEQGYVKMPKVNLVEEMVDMVAASRAYEANVSVMEAGKKMAQNTLKI